MTQICGEKCNKRHKTTLSSAGNGREANVVFI